MSDPDEVCVCPYNMAHSIVLSRMQFHLSKCRQQYPGGEKVQCPFNTTHIVDQRELDWHIKWCRERIALDQMLYKVGSGPSFVQQPKLDLGVPPVLSNQEVWDAEDTAPCSVLEAVKELSISKPTLRNKICASESVRKAHKLNERRRFVQVINEGPKTNPQNLDNLDVKNAEKTKPKVQQQIEHSYKSSDEDSDPPHVSSNPEPAFVRHSAPTEEKEVTEASSVPQPKINNSSTSRDPHNPWGQSKPVSESSFGDILRREKEESRITMQASKEENKSSIIKSEKTPGLAWGIRKPTANLNSPVNEVTPKPQQMSFTTRDRGNPWRKTNIAANFQGPEDEFPSLPMSGRGRGKRF